MTSNANHTLVADIDALLATTARLYALDGAAREVAILANAQYNLHWSGQDWGVDYYWLYLQIPGWLYSQIYSDVQKCEQKILQKAQELTKPYPNDGLRGVSISPILSADKDWREKANNWVAGKGVTNQGRVRSDNIPSRTLDGLLFRSENEILFYKALKSLGVTFAPLPVFIRGGETYKRIEPDFVIVKDGVMLVVEIDGDTVHHETPAEAHARTTMLAHEGVHIERIRASDCKTQEQANACAKKIIEILDKIKSLR
ncbi:hypothetical protein SD81_025390 [Tolypothrix campylonemoides VB511288]|nr:hypothetical protein SD81_025390 [Tolypothrix campylonemoides VB511288]